jgi:hypothetical protein
VDAAIEERRRDTRYGQLAAHGIVARVRPGREVVLVDVSPSGALIESASPLRPGARVHVHLKTSASATAFNAHVTRCAVAAITDAGVVYCAALHFDHRNEWVGQSLGAERIGEGHS